ncbi:hypothetical protein COV20_04495 [Candidatus Woesearchaeota archaeon CG10_big_fil_rev_8_21_14_0_10_45_16]|nr:MAG: hypothetical protein COV20_04495 [Candidatus Woesearchaeota archaeon CG10_big_fil_rev_8_21_14_0_10_45_16]
MQKRGVPFILVFVVLVLLVAGCGRVPGGANARDTAALAREAQSGTQGVELEIQPNFPPATVYDLNDLTALVEVKNKGNFNLERQDCFVQITGFDPNIIRGGFGLPQPCSQSTNTLEGKNVYNIEGGFDQLEFTSPAIQLPDNVGEYNPTLQFVSCYNYQTHASPLVCVDPLFYQVSADQKTCQPRDVSTGGGQGAPVAVTNVNVDMIGQNRAVFEISIANLGGGTVLSPGAGIQNCGGAVLSRQDLNKVQYEVRLSGQSPLNCKPRDGTVLLNNNQGKIVCTFNIPGTLAYETPLQINLQYSYLDSQSRTLRIVKTPG